MKFKKILLDVDVSSKTELFELIARNFLELDVISNEKDFIDALNEREESMSTGLLSGIAIPHGRSETVKSNEVLVLLLKNSIEYETLDDSEVKCVFALAVSMQDNHHLETLSQLSSRLVEEECIEALKQAKTREEIAQLFA